MRTLLSLALIAAAGARSLGVTITPVGPEGRTHHALSINERGDILFDLDTVLGLDYQLGDDIPTAELWHADGTITTILEPGSIGGWTVGLGEDGTVLSRTVHRFERPDDYPHLRTTGAVTGPDGTPIVYPGSSPHAAFDGFLSDGRLFGSGEAREFLDYQDGHAPSTPLIWSPGTGETVLDLPAGHASGRAQWANPAGGVVGVTSTGYGGDAFLTWWNDDATVRSTYSFDNFYNASPDRTYNLGGVTSEGSFIAIVGTQIVTLTPDGTMTPLGAPAPEDTYVSIEEVHPSGLMVGTTLDLDDPSFTFAATLWSRWGQRIVLQDLMPPDSPWRLTFAHDITSDGTILVEAVHRDQSSRFQSFVIRGIPVPGAGGLLGVLLLASVRRARR